ncbi:MAG TPA: hypothetical protein VK674_01405 [Candidatus Limnocylindria bacterium]|nr:hypothetical protein [Candidatus Limnocylindria bacterium]
MVGWPGEEGVEQNLLSLPSLLDVVSAQDDRYLDPTARLLSEALLPEQLTRLRGLRPGVLGLPTIKELPQDPELPSDLTGQNELPPQIEPFKSKD